MLVAEMLPEITVRSIVKPQPSKPQVHLGMGPSSLDRIAEYVYQAKCRELLSDLSDHRGLKHRIGRGDVAVQPVIILGKLLSIPLNAPIAVLIPEMNLLLGRKAQSGMQLQRLV